MADTLSTPHKDAFAKSLLSGPRQEEEVEDAGKKEVLVKTMLRRAFSPFSVVGPSSCMGWTFFVVETFHATLINL